MYEEKIVSSKTARLAKEKGFNYKTNLFYDQNNDIEDFDHCERYSNIELSESEYLKENYVECICAPTQSLLNDWFRNVHNFHIQISYNGIHYKDKHPSYRCIIKDIKGKQIKEIINPIETEFFIFSSYEEVLEEALFQALLII